MILSTSIENFYELIRFIDRQSCSEFLSSPNLFGLPLCIFGFISILRLLSQVNRNIDGEQFTVCMGDWRRRKGVWLADIGLFFFFPASCELLFYGLMVFVCRRFLTKYGVQCAVHYPDGEGVVSNNDDPLRQEPCLYLIYNCEDSSLDYLRFMEQLVTVYVFVLGTRSNRGSQSAFRSFMRSVSITSATKYSWHFSNPPPHTHTHTFHYKLDSFKTSV